MSSWNFEPGSGSDDGFESDDTHSAYDSYDEEDGDDYEQALDIGAPEDMDKSNANAKHAKPDFTAGNEWHEDHYLIRVSGSLRQLAKEAGKDHNNKDKPYKVCLDKGITIERCSEFVGKRLDENAQKFSREQLHKNPRKAEDRRDIVKTVDVTGENGFPVGLRLKLNNLMGSASNSFNDGNTISRCLVIGMHPNQKFKNHNVMNNRVTDEDLKNIRSFNNSSGSLKSSSDVSTFPTKDGEPEMLLVRHPRMDPHMVLKKIELMFEKDPDATEAERRYTHDNKMPPDHIMSRYNKNDSLYKVDKKTFDRYEKKCADEIRNRPTSDVANPYGHLSRMGVGGHFRSAKTANAGSKTINLMESGASVNSTQSSDGVASWTDPDGLSVGGLASKSEENAQRNLDRIYHLNLSVRVRHADREDTYMTGKRGPGK